MPWRRSRSPIAAMSSRPGSSFTAARGATCSTIRKSARRISESEARQDRPSLRHAGFVGIVGPIFRRFGRAGDPFEQELDMLGLFARELLGQLVQLRGAG